MDILGSIMKKMERPPSLSEKERLQLKQRREQMQKQKDDEQKRMQKFKETVLKKITDFAADESQERLKLETMSKPQRAIVHDMAETARLVAIAFGHEEVDRHVILFKHDTAPCEAEIASIRRGEEYNPAAVKAANEQAEEEESREEEEQRANKAKSRKNNGKRNEAAPEYLQKYQKHFGGLDVAKDAAKSTETNRSYGFVSSEQKKDKRTIEDIQADIRAKKKLRTEQL